MAIVYVDSNNVSGTYDGLAWSTAYQDLALTAPNLVSGDIVYVASNHIKDYGASTTYSLPNLISLFSVNSTTGSYEVGAEELAGAGSNIDYKITVLSEGGMLSLSGIEIGAGDELDIHCGVGGRTYLQDCVLNVFNSATGADVGTALNDGEWVMHKSCTINFTSAGNTTVGAIEVGSGGTLTWDGMKGTGTPVNILFDSMGNGGATINLLNTDLTLFVASGGAITGGSVLSDDLILLNIERCKLPLVFDYVLGVTFATFNHKISVSSCDNGDGYHYFYQENYEGIVEENLINYLAATYDKAKTLGFSTDMDSNADAGIGNPLKFKLASLALDLTTSKTLTVNFTCANTLTDGEFWIEVTRPDATDNTLGVVQSGRVTDILAGTAHTTNAEAWTSGLANTYEQSITIPALTGVDTAVVDVHVYLAKPLETVIVDPLIVVS